MDSNIGRPVIARVFKIWEAPPGLTYALVADVERNLWVVESCPAGTHLWTLAQAAELPRGRHTRGPLDCAVRMGRTLLRADRRRASRDFQPAGMEAPRLSTARRGSLRPLSGSGRAPQRRVAANVG
jgi:hypothetical protein